MLLACFAPTVNFVIANRTHFYDHCGKRRRSGESREFLKSDADIMTVSSMASLNGSKEKREIFAIDADHLRSEDFLQHKRGIETMHGIYKIIKFSNKLVDLHAPDDLVDMYKTCIYDHILRICKKEVTVLVG